MSLGNYHHINFIRAIKSDVRIDYVDVRYMSQRSFVFTKNCFAIVLSEQWGPGWRVTQCFMKHFVLSMSVKQNLSVSVFVHKCLMLNVVEHATFKMFVTQISNYLFVISFRLMFYKTLRFSLARPMSHIVGEKLEEMACLLSWMSGKATSAKNFIFRRRNIDGE